MNADTNGPGFGRSIVDDQYLTDESVAIRLARGRQWIAHQGAGYIPPWDGLAPHEQEQAVTEARHWLRAAYNTGIQIVPAGRTVFDLPAPTFDDSDLTEWEIGHYSVMADRLEGTISVAWGDGEEPAAEWPATCARPVILALLAACDRMAALDPATSCRQPNRGDLR